MKGARNQERLYSYPQLTSCRGSLSPWSKFNRHSWSIFHRRQHFWVRSSKTGVHCVAFVNSGNDRSYVTEYTVLAANTWEYKTVTVSGGLITAGTWDTTTGVGLRVIFTLASGTSLRTTPNAWQTGLFNATTNQVNHADSVTNVFAITGVQLEVGTIASPFDHRPIGAEMLLCQRYYANLTKSQSPIQVSGFTNGVAGTLQHPATMRVAPTVSTNIADGNFSASGAPPANTWGLQVIGVAALSKTGTASITVTADPDKTLFYIYTATFSGNSNVLSPGAGIFVTSTAEL